MGYMPMAKYFEVKNQSGNVIVDDTTSFYALDSVKKLSNYTQTESLSITTSRHGTSIRDTGFRHLYGYTIGAHPKIVLWGCIATTTIATSVILFAGTYWTQPAQRGYWTFIQNKTKKVCSFLVLFMCLSFPPLDQ